MPLKKLKEEEKASTESLVAAIEHKDRRFRLFQTLFMVGTFVALMVIIGAQQRTLDGVEEQLRQAETIATEESKQNEAQQNKIVRRLNCMVYFFTIPQRQNLTIEHIDECTLNRDNSVDQFFENPEPINTEQPPNLPNSAPTATQENDEAPAPQQPTTQNPNPQTPPSEDRSPVTLETPIIDIPLCVPLTGLCIR